MLWAGPNGPGLNLMLAHASQNLTGRHITFKVAGFSDFHIGGIFPKTKMLISNCDDKVIPSNDK